MGDYKKIFFVCFLYAAAIVPAFGECYRDGVKGYYCDDDSATQLETKAKKRFENDYNKCIKFDSVSSGSVSFITNECTEKLSVRWRDAGHCNRVCGDVVAPGARSTAVKIIGSFRYATCKYPSVPDKWNGELIYRCK